MKRFLVFVAVIIIPTLIILLYPYQKSSGIGSIEATSFPGWQTSQQLQPNCGTQLRGYPFIYLYQQACQRGFNIILLVADFALLAGIIFVVGLLVHYFRKPPPVGVRQLKLRLTEFKLLISLTGISAIFVIYGILSGLVQLTGVITLLLSGLVFGGIGYFLFNRWKNHDLHQKLQQVVKRSGLFFGGLIAFMLVLFVALLIGQRFNEGLNVRETFGAAALGVIFICFAVQIIFTIFKDVLKYAKRSKS